jgi:hypothetical protein
MKRVTSAMYRSLAPESFLESGSSMESCDARRRMHRDD